MPSHERNISTEEQWLIDQISEVFIASAKWPKSDKLARDAARKNVDMPEIFYGATPNDFFWRPDIDGTLVLSLTGLWRSHSGKEFAADFFRVALFCRDIYLSDDEAGDDEQPRITSHDLRSRLGLDEEIIKRIYLEMAVEYYLSAGGAHPSDEDWYFYINPRVEKFRDVDTIEDYFEVRARIVAPSSPRLRPDLIPMNFQPPISQDAGSPMREILGIDSVKMKPVAQLFYRAAIMAFEHARQHSFINNDMDAAQVVLSLDFGVEMLLKAVFLNRDKSIMVERSRQSLGLHEMLKEFRNYKNVSAVEILRVRRNDLQHFAGYTDVNTTRDLYEGTLLFVSEVMESEFDEKQTFTIPEDSIPFQFPLEADLVFEVSQLQRDVDASDTGIVTWAQGEIEGSSLVVFVKQSDGEPARLTPENAFEYMPKTCESRIVCYRQSGGIILYDIETNERTLISEVGMPTAINRNWIAAQGLEAESGLVGGIWLWNLADSKWEQVSAVGDSARLADRFVVWQELEGEAMAIKYRGLDGGEVKTITRNGTHPSAFGELIAWTDWKDGSSLHVTDLRGSDIYGVSNAIFPCLRENLVAYLRSENDTYSLVIDDISKGVNILHLPFIGFPIGNGPALSQDAVYFESRTGRPVHAIWRKLIDRNL